MNGKEREYEIKKENYFVLASIIVLVLILVMIMINLNYYIRKNKENSNMETMTTLHRLERDKQAVLNPSCLIVLGEDKTNSIEIIEGSLEKAKIGYISKVAFEDITDNELESAEIIIINGSEFGSLGSMDMLTEFLTKGKHIIFTSMPDVDYFRKSQLKEIMGIKKITQSKYQEGINFLPGFLLGGLLEFPELSYNAPEVELLSTTKTYVTGEEDLSVIWRNVYGESEIYVVNGPFIETNVGYGILSALMAEIYSDYIYPVVNAKVYTYSGFPYISNENTNELQKIYSRNAMQLQQDILIPDILSINQSRNLIPSGFITDNFNNDNREGINKYTKKQINNYEKDIYKLGGEVGMVYSGDLEKDMGIYHDLLNDKNFNSILLNETEFDTINELIDEEQFSSIESVLGPWTVESFGYLTENTVYIPFTLDGIANTDLKKLETYSGITAFGAIIQNLNLEQVIYPREDKDNWMNVSLDYIKFTDSYRMKFQMIEARNITDAAQAVKKFVNNSPSIGYYDHKIEIRSGEWSGESYYILRTNKDVDSINGGIIEEIEEGAYLVTAKNTEVDINLKPIDRYE